MSSIIEICLVGRILHHLQNYGSWCGETHIQKNAYVAKALNFVPLESDFILYKHGPFSFDLNNLLTQMRAQQIISITPQGIYGSSFRLNDAMWAALVGVVGNVYEKYDGNIQFVCSLLAKKRVTELERVATAIYVYLNFPELSRDLQQRKLNELKPHISLPEARAAFDEASVFIKAAM